MRFGTTYTFCSHTTPGLYRCTHEQARPLAHAIRHDLHILLAHYTWPLPLHTRASSTSRACDSARLTHSARTLHLASTVAHTSKLDLSRMRFGTTYTFCSHTRASQPASVTHIRASTPCTHHWHRQQRATRIFGLHVRATEAYIPCPHTRTNTR
jgi:YHS domain-containing protein